MRRSTFPTPLTIAGLPRSIAAVYGALFLAALVGYAWLWPQAPVIAGDTPSYLTVARDLSDYHIDQLHDRSPGYPLLLVALNSSEHPTRALLVVTLLLHLASIWIVGVVLFAAGARAGLLITACLLLLLPPSVESAAYVMTETLAQFMLVAGVGALLFWLTRPGRASHAWLGLAAAALAYAALTRPTYQALAPVLALTLCALALAARPLLPIRRAMTAGAVLLLGAVIILGGYAHANKRATGYFGITPMAGLNLSTRTVPVIERLPDEYAEARDILIRMRDAQLVKPGSSHTGYSYIHDARPELARATGLEPRELSAYMLQLNLWLIRHAPLQYLEEVARALGPYWFPSSRQLANMDSRRLQLLWTVLHFALVAAFALQLLVIGGVGVHQLTRWLLHTDDGRMLTWLQGNLFGAIAYLLAAVLVFYTMALSCLFDVGDTRQRVSTDVFIVFMALLGAQWWWRSITVPAAPRRAVEMSKEVEYELCETDSALSVSR